MLKPATVPSTTSERRNDIIQMQEPLTQTTCPNSTCCAGDSPARHFLMLAEGKDLPTPEALCSLKLPDWLKPNGHGICCLKMFPAFYRMTMGRPLRPSSPHWMTWGMRRFCLEHPQAKMSGRDTFFAFRIDTSRYRYYLRLFPQKQKFFIFCYQTDQFKQDRPTPDYHYQYRKKPRAKQRSGGERA